MPTSKKSSGMFVKISENIPAISKELYDITCKWANKFYERKTKLSARGERVKKALDAVAEEYSADMIVLLETIASEALGEEIHSLKKKMLVFEAGVVVVPLANNNSHSYELGAPILRIQGNNFISADGKKGNHMDENLKSCRPATLAEITEFLTKCTKTESNNLLVALDSITEGVK